jgi:hypothetical protein
MTLSLLTILAALLPFAIWLYKRHAAIEADPIQQYEEHREQIAKEILRSDEAAANRSLDDDLDRLRALQSDPGRQNRPPT